MCLLSSVLIRRETEIPGYRRYSSAFPKEYPGQTHKQTAKTINVSSGSQQSEEFLELANGCLCCSIKDSGVAAIENLMKRKGAFDYILLETTGLADPGKHSSFYCTGVGHLC